MNLECQSDAKSTALKHLRFFKAEDETEDELRLMGYHRLLTVYPAAHLAAGTALEPAELGELFVEGGRAGRP